MGIWKNPTTLEQLKERAKGTMIEHLGIEYLEIGENYLKARMPVDWRTRQPAGILHGGASATLAETLGSTAASMCLGQELKRVVGLEINANHIHTVTEGWVVGVTTPIHMGTKTQIWEIKIYNAQEKLVCISRLTVANIDA